jgi:hypothetical protein
METQAFLAVLAASLALAAWSALRYYRAGAPSDRWPPTFGHWPRRLP